MNKLILFTGLSIFLMSCGGLGEKKEQKLADVGITVTIPGDTKITCYEKTEYTQPRCEYTIGKQRVEVKEIKEASYPTDLTMLEEAVKGDEKLKSITEKKTLLNGAFGIIFERNGKSKVIKDFLFYFKKEDRVFKITPVFNNEGKYFTEIIESIGTFK